VLFQLNRDALLVSIQNVRAGPIMNCLRS